MIDLPFQSFLSGSNLTVLLSNLKWILFFVAPVILIAVALDSLGYLINVIKGLFIKEESNDDDFDYKNY